MQNVLNIIHTSLDKYMTDLINKQVELDILYNSDDKKPDIEKIFNSAKDIYLKINNEIEEYRKFILMNILKR